jgi:hypothetical protein
MLIRSGSKTSDQVQGLPQEAGRWGFKTASRHHIENHHPVNKQMVFKFAEFSDSTPSEEGQFKCADLEEMHFANSSEMMAVYGKCNGQRQ